MMPFREGLSLFFSSRSLTWDTALLLLGALAYFFALPLQSDTTALIVAVTLVAIAVTKKRALGPRLFAPSIKWPLLAVVFYVLIALAAAVCNMAVIREFPRMVLWLCCVFSGAVFGLVFPRNGGRYMWGALVGIAVSFAVAVLFYGYDASAIWHDGRLKLFALHPSRLAVYAAVAFLFLLHRAVTGKTRERLLAVAGALFLLFILVKTNTRGNLFMLPIGLLFLGVALPKCYWKRFGLALLVCAVLTSGAIWTAKDTVTGKRLVSVVTDVTEDPNFISRQPIWEAGWESFKESPLIGHGYHSYRALHAAYVQKHGPELQARYGGYEKTVKQAHNIVLGRLVDTGLLGAVAFFFFYAAAILAAWRGAQENKWLVAPLVFYLGMSMLDDGLFRMNDAFILFIAGNALTSGLFGASSFPKSVSS
ncbi:MAG: hypothetical protein DELT_00832 [Desulfovibrio sp.]